MKLLKTSLIALLAIVTVLGFVPNPASHVEAAGSFGPGVPVFQVNNLAAEFQITGCATGQVTLNTTLLLDPNTNYYLSMFVANSDGETATRRAFPFSTDANVPPFPVQLIAYDTSDYSVEGDNILLPNGTALVNAGDFPLDPARNYRYFVELTDLDSGRASNVSVAFNCGSGTINTGASSVNNDAGQFLTPAARNG